MLMECFPPAEVARITGYSLSTLVRLRSSRGGRTYIQRQNERLDAAARAERLALDMARLEISARIYSVLL